MNPNGRSRYNSIIDGWHALFGGQGPSISVVVRINTVRGGEVRVHRVACWLLAKGGIVRSVCISYMNDIQKESVSYA